MARPLSDTAREKMLAAASDIIDTCGAAACTVDEVARRSGVAKTTIYRHFGDRDALVLAVVDDRIHSVEPPDTGSLRGDLRAIVQGYLGAASFDATRKMFIWMLTRSMDDPEFTAQFRNVKVQPKGPTVIALQRGIARGEVDPDIPIELAMHVVQGPFMSMRIIENQTLEPEQFECMIDMIVNALRPRPKEDS
jgi:AcrR family transcriptional regulator